MAELNVKIICFGEATQDVFVTGKALAAKRDVRTLSYVEQFPLGAKIDLEAVHFDTGGGASNGAVTFARQGFESELVTKVGHDPAAAEVLRVMKKEGVATGHIAYDRRLSTSYSVLLLAPNGERTILNYRGPLKEFSAREVAFGALIADWYYITSLHGNMGLLSKLIAHANKRGIKVALNPGRSELSQARKLRKLLPKIEVLIANREEMRQLFGGESAKETLMNGFGICHYIVLTDGPEGTLATDGDKLYQAGLYQKVKVVDRTGAGDAFGSGFVAAIAKGLAIEDALTLGAANSTSVVTKVGAKAGILRTANLRRMKVKTLSI